MTISTNKALQAAQHTPFDPDEMGGITRAIFESIPGIGRHPAFFGAMCFLAGIAEGKAQERQRRRSKRATSALLKGSGDFLYTVEGDGAAPAFVAGDVVTIRAAACTPDLQTARAVVIRQGDRALIGRLVMYPDGRADLIHAGQLVPFDPERDFIGPVVSVWRSLEPAAPATE